MIQFFNQDIEFVLNNKLNISSWIQDTFQFEGINKDIELSIIFCSDDFILNINKQFLNHDYYTDIITFPIEEDDDVLEAELYISIDRVKDNAQSLDKTFINELLRVIIHGVLHLSGYEDKSVKQETEMRSKENLYLTKLFL